MLFYLVPTTATDSTSSMEVLEIAAGGGQESGGVVTKGDGRSLADPMIIGDDYLQGEDSEVKAAFSGTDI